MSVCAIQTYKRSSRLSDSHLCIVFEYYVIKHFSLTGTYFLYNRSSPKCVGNLLRIRKKASFCIFTTKRWALLALYFHIWHISLWNGRVAPESIRRILWRSSRWLISQLYFYVMIRYKLMHNISVSIIQADSFFHHITFLLILYKYPHLFLFNKTLVNCHNILIVLRPFIYTYPDRFALTS